MSAPVVHSVAELRQRLGAARAVGNSVGAVPTMGALHEGHLSLVRRAKKVADEVVVTIFVNPTQFGPDEDFEHYPRTMDKDVQLASTAGATLIFAPSVSEMYPVGEQTRVRVSNLSLGLCGESRPGHFDGVATIVTKLFHAVGEGVYFFGEKDYQQLRLIERMARDLLFPVSVVGCPIVREPDGLAMSSRNAYLTTEERKRALSLSQALGRASSAYSTGERSVAALTALVRGTLSEAGVDVHYIELRDARELTAHSEGRLPEVDVVLAVAGKVGRTRLIDNVVLTPHLGGVTEGAAR